MDGGKSVGNQDCQHLRLWLGGGCSPATRSGVSPDTTRLSGLLSRVHLPAVFGARIKDIGGPQNRTDRIPVSPLAYYQWKAQYSYTTAAEVAKGVDRAKIFYRRRTT